MTMKTPFPVGTRVRLVKDVDNYPHVWLKPGETGVVTDFEDGHRERRLHILLDKHHDELAEWLNVLQIYEDVEHKNPPVEFLRHGDSADGRRPRRHGRERQADRRRRGGLGR